MDGKPTTPTETATPRKIVRRAVRLTLLAGGIAGLCLIGAYFLVVINYALDLTRKLQAILGLSSDAGTCDWLSLVVLVVILGIPILAALYLYHQYRRAWSLRVMAIWGSGRLARRHATVPGIGSGRPGAVARQERYLRDLVNTQYWRDSLTRGDGTTPDGSDLARDAGNILAACEKDIAGRAIATGLVVGISPSRFLDQLMIVGASLEMQLHVLARLGRQPGLRVWYELLVRAGSSLFANSYLNREDAFMLSYTTKGIATGLSALGDTIDSMEFEEAFDAAENMLSRFATGDISGTIVNTALTGIEFGTEQAMSIGASGLQLMSELIEKTGDELFQGVLSGGMLYYHGMAIAADSLALDKQHRNSSAMSRSPVACMTAVARSAGQMALDYVRKRRRLLRAKKRAALNKIPVVGRTIATVNTAVGGTFKFATGASSLAGKAIRGTGDAIKTARNAFRGNRHKEDEGSSHEGEDCSGQH